MPMTGTHFKTVLSIARYRKLKMYLTLTFVFILIIGYSFVDSRDIEKSGQSRVVGGYTATEPYPYQVSLDGPSVLGPGGIVYNWHHVCGGSIISNRHILTAAHCVIEDDGTYTQKEDLSILAGTNDLNNGGTRYYPMKNVTHPKYMIDRQGYDIAIITVVGTIRFVPKKVQPIKYSKEETKADVICVLTGWGSTGKLVTGPYPNDLQEVYLPTISNEDCKATPSYSFVSSTNICTKVAKGEGACSGDSGGPLVDVHTNTLVGIAEAVNSGGCGIGQPDIFIRVSTFYYWIERQTKSDLSTNTVPAVVKIPTFQGK